MRQQGRLNGVAVATRQVPNVLGRSSAEFGGSERLYPAPTESDDDTELAKSLNLMVRREGLEPPTLRFEERIGPQQEREVTLAAWQVAAWRGT